MHSRVLSSLLSFALMLSALLAGNAVLAGEPLVSMPAGARNVITQRFDASWSVEPWDYYGERAASRWQYLPFNAWDPGLGTLVQVVVRQRIAGTRKNPNDDLHIRTAFVAGSNPAHYFLSNAITLPRGTSSFGSERTLSFSSGQDLAAWVNYPYEWTEQFFLEAKTLGGGHSIEVETTLEYHYVR
jgi:hypothetical protein